MADLGEVPPGAAEAWIVHRLKGYNSHVKKASVSEAKNRLSALLDRVRHGHTIVIEDRGVPVARLEPIAGGGAADGRVHGWSGMG